MSWKTWTAAGAITLALFAIYAFAAARPEPEPEPELATSAVRETGPRPLQLRTPGVDAIHTEWLEAQTGSYNSRRNLFSFPTPPPPPPPKAPPPPPDADRDGIPDFRDNCVKVANPDQQDMDRDGIGTLCESEAEIAPPPPPPPKPVPPPFSFKYIGTFGNAASPIATFQRDGQIVNARVGDIIDGKFILRSVGIESVEIGFIGFPPDERQRIPLGK